MLGKGKFKWNPNNLVNQTTIKGRRVFTQWGSLQAGYKNISSIKNVHVFPLKKKTCKIGLNKEEKGRV